jgi:hypothetical protein
MDKRIDEIVGLEFSEESTADLRGRQSVRTTFKLTARSIDALSILAGQLGIKQKSLFDHLIEDTRALRLIAQEFEHFGERTQRVAKTYVISRKTLENLERVAGQFNTPRDALVEYSIERVIPLLQREKHKHEQRKKLLSGLQNYLQEGIHLLEVAEKTGLDMDDPAFVELEHMLRAVQSCAEAVDAMVEKGKKIEEF